MYGSWNTIWTSPPRRRRSAVVRAGCERSRPHAAIVPLVSLFYSFIRNSDWLLDVFPLLAFSAGAALFVAFARLLRREARLADKR